MILACTSSRNVSASGSNAEASDRARIELSDTIVNSSQYDVASIQNPSLDCSLN
ncbi:MAG: hypothetical protein K2J15_02510 [Muribaculaceae bacterium]|nr:hypothetical protein [Muribaculaceae bacterium]